MRRVGVVVGSFGLALVMGSPAINAYSVGNPIVVRQNELNNKILPHTPFYSHSTLRDNFRVLDHLTKARQITIVVDSGSRLQALSQYSQEVSTPGSPVYHQFLTPAEVDQRFGPTSAMVSQSASALSAAGWHVISHQGFVLKAVIPNRITNPELPVSPNIWSMTGLTPQKVVPNAQVKSQKSKITNGNVAKGTDATYSNTSTFTTNLVSAYNLRLSPQFVSSATATNGDTVIAMSWNPGFATSLPAGLPWNLVIAAESADGQPIAITGIESASDMQNIVGVFATSNQSGFPFPGSNNALWQVEAEALTRASAGDTLSLDITLQDGSSETLNVPLPAFTGSSTGLQPLSGPQLNTLIGATHIVGSQANARPPIAVYCQGQVPSLSDLQTLMTQEGLPMPQVNFTYFDGSSSTMTNTQDFVESELDLQAIASVDPGSTIDEFVYPAVTTVDTFSAMLSTLSQQSQIKVASFSYGFYGEDPNTVAVLVNACIAEGITIVYASGDQGAWETGNNPGPVGVESNDGQPGILTVGGLDFASPASFSNSGSMTSVVGPAIAKAWGGDYLNGLPLLVAQDYTSPNAASTGGFGTEPIPSWQHGFLPSTATGIGVPDISSLAGIPLFSGIYQGQAESDGGTSLAAPLTAGWLSDLEGTIGATQGLGNVNPLIFESASQDPQDFIQASWGSNGIYSVTSSSSGSWNPVTGLGQPEWGNLANLWGSNAVASFSVASSSSVATVGSPVNYLVSAVNALGTPVNFNGTLDVTSSDPTAKFPATIFMTNGKAQFSIAYDNPGSQNVTVSLPTISGTLVGSSAMLNVVSNFTLSSNTSSASVGGSVTITASGSDLPSPTYQFWIYDPANHQWTSSNSSGANQITFSESVPGTYQVVAYAWSNEANSSSIEASTSIVFSAQNGHPMVSNLAVTTNSPVFQPVGGGFTATADATDPGGSPLYQFWVHGPNNQWTQVQNYSAKPSFSLSNLSQGSYVIAVFALDAQQVSQKQWSQAYYTSAFVDIGSSLSLTVPTTGLVGDPLLFSAQAIGVTNPVYQFWIELPSGTWVSSGAYGSPNYIFTPLQPGTYKVAGFAKDPYAPSNGKYSLESVQTFEVP